MRNVLLWGFVAVALAGFASVATAQQGRPGGGFGGFGGGNSLLDIVSREDVAKELELVDDQVTKLKDIRTKQDEARRARAGAGGRPNFQDLTEDERAKLAEERAAREKEVNTQVEGVLSPAQVERAKQLRVQLQLQGGGFGGFGGGGGGTISSRATQLALSRGEIADALGIDDTQKEKLTEAGAAAQKELAEETAKLQEAARKKILDVLTPEQKAKWEKMIGEPFQFARPQGGQGGRGGQPGQPGGRGRAPGGAGGNGSI